jgi:hypothetical protein
MAELLDFPGLSSTSDHFRSELVRQAQASRLDPNKVAAVLSLESKFDPKARNGSHAGLLQFAREYFPELARAAGVDVKWEDLPKLSGEEQLPLVTQYFRQHGLRASSPARDYLVATFVPNQIGQETPTVIGKRGSSEYLPGTHIFLGTIYAQNPGYDTNQDGEITIGDLQEKIDGLIRAAAGRETVPVEPVLGSALGWFGALLLAFGISVAAFRRS